MPVLSFQVAAPQSSMIPNTRSQIPPGPRGFRLSAFVLREAHPIESVPPRAMVCPQEVRSSRTEMWLQIANILHVGALIAAAVASIGIYQLVKRLTPAKDEQILLTQAQAPEATKPTEVAKCERAKLDSRFAAANDKPS